MIRLYVIAEGDTEKSFAQGVLCPHLGKYDITTSAFCVVTNMDKQRGIKHSGGLFHYDRVKSDIEKLIKSDRSEESRFTTMFDLYGLPHSFPEYDTASREANAYQKVKVLEEALKNDIGDQRFIPYIQLHEFEALIFTEPEKLKEVYLNEEREIRQLVDIASRISPEDINEGPNTAPSKRIINVIKAYDKAYAGTEVIKAIGLDKIRNKCPHFNEWLTYLEKLAGKSR